MEAHHHELGICKYDQGVYAEAIGLYKKAIAIGEKYYPDSLNLAGCYNNIGLVYCDMGENARALSYYENTLAMQQQSLPPNRPSLAVS